jgi:hypothetical protein
MIQRAWSFQTSQRDFLRYKRRGRIRWQAIRAIDVLDRLVGRFFLPSSVQREAAAIDEFNGHTPLAHHHLHTAFMRCYKCGVPQTWFLTMPCEPAAVSSSHKQQSFVRSGQRITGRPTQTEEVR